MVKKPCNIMKYIPVLFLLLIIGIIPDRAVAADTASAVTIGAIDYETLTMQVYNNYNTIVYFSTDNKTWEELEAAYNNGTKAYTMDISWVLASSDVTIYFKGDIVKTVKSVTLPSQNSSFTVEYDKVEGEFSFDEVGDATTFEWRKATNYNWVSVSLTESYYTYKSFLSEMEKLRVKGAVIVIRIPQEKGTGMSNVGKRPSVEKKVTITARGAAPTVKVNSSKLTINTSTTLEYYDSSSGVWITCDASMAIEDIAPKALYVNGGKPVTLIIRKAATASAPYSKTQYLTIPGQKAAPTIGGNSNDITYYYMNSKLMLQFNKATTENIFEYAVVRADSEFDPSSASWKTVNSTKLMTMSTSSVPEGCTIYFRMKGTDANTSTDAVLASAMSSITVSYK